MSHRFVIEAIMLAVHGRLLTPDDPVEYIIPYTTIEELYEVIDLEEQILSNHEEDTEVKRKIGDLIAYFEESFNKKKLERALMRPWKKSPPILIGEKVIITVIYALENEEFGESFDPIETELILTAQKEDIPLLTDQIEFLNKIDLHHMHVYAYDIEEFDHAIEYHN